MKADRPIIYFNDALVAHTNYQRYIGRYLTFLEYSKEDILKANMGIGVTGKLGHIQDIF